jgi:hypothetical protein
MAALDRIGLGGQRLSARHFRVLATGHRLPPRGLRVVPFTQARRAGGPPYGPDVITGSQIYASNDESLGDADLAADGNASGGWLTNNLADDAWWSVDFGASNGKIITKVELDFQSDAPSRNAIEIRGTLTGGSLASSTLIYRKSHAFANNTTFTYEFNNLVRYEKYFFVQKYSGSLGTGSAKEWRAYESVAVPVVLTDHKFAAGGSSVTFPSCLLGSPAGNRKIVVGAAAQAAAGATPVQSLTIAGVASSLVAAVSTGTYTTELWQANVPDGTTGNIVVTFNNTHDYTGIGVYAVYNAKGAPHDTGGSIANPMTDTLNIPADGVAIGCAFNSNGATSFLWTAGGLHELYDENVGGVDYHCGGAACFTQAKMNYTITCTPDAGSTAQLMVLASWGPK